MRDLLRTAFSERFGRPPRGVAFAPGRVNLIGEHTDYNDGFVCPVAIDRRVWIAYDSAAERRLTGYSIDYDDDQSAELYALSPGTRSESWFDYVSGTAWVMRTSGSEVSGMDFVVAGDVPRGAGLSSSAALELASARALYDVSGLDWDPRAGAVVGQRVENEFIGLRSGIMDQMAAALSVEGAAMLLDCRDLSARTVPLLDDLAIVVIDTGTRRAVAESAYNERRASCERVVAEIARHAPDVRALRDASLEHLQEASARLDESDVRRATHVILENERVLAFVQALEADDVDLDWIRELMVESHRSLRDLYEVSSPELDAVVSAAVEDPACRGARMTGAGFGGCAVALVERERQDRIATAVRRAVGGANIYECRAVSGVGLDS